MSAEAISIAISIVAVAVSLAAIIRTTLPDLTVDEIELTQPGTYRITVGNVGSSGAKHVVVSLHPESDREASKESTNRTAGRTVHVGKSVHFEIHTTAEAADYPLKIKLHWQWLGLSRSKTSGARIEKPDDQQPVVADVPADVASGPHLPITNATFDEIWNRLVDFEYPGLISSRRWAEILDMQDRMEHPEVGEILEPSDWHEFPEGVNLRVMVIKSGEAITVRWASAEGFEHLGCPKGRPGHQYLLGPGEEPARSGWVTRHGQVLTIQS